MPSADQVPVNKTHSTMLWPMWAVLIAGSTGSALRAGRPPNLHITPDVRCDLVQAASAAGFLYRSPLAYVFAARAEHSSSSRLRRSHKSWRRLAQACASPPASHLHRRRCVSRGFVVPMRQSASVPPGAGAKPGSRLDLERTCGRPTHPSHPTSATKSDAKRAFEGVKFHLGSKASLWGLVNEP